jgi:hypothetical protein
MRTVHTTGRWGRAAIGVGGLGALLLAVGCGSGAGTGAAAQTPQPVMPSMTTPGQTGLPVVVSCEPGQRTIVKPTIVNGAAMSQVACVAGEVSQPVAYAQPVMPAQPLATPAVYRATRPRPVYRDVDDTEVVPVSTRAAVQPVRAGQVVPVRQSVYERARVQQRTVKKSAIIIGSSSGVGAGVGAAVGGKKGALIGAVIGGGGAALWDQVTRRKN